MSSLSLKISNEIASKLSSNAALKSGVSKLTEEVEQLFASKLEQLVSEFSNNASGTGGTVSNASSSANTKLEPIRASKNTLDVESTSSFLAAQIGNNSNINSPPTSKITSPLQLSNHEFKSGNIGLKLHGDGERISQVFYYGNDGELKGSSAFYAPEILKATEKYGVNLEDLKGLGKQLDAAGIGYKPYEQYAKEGSNHGIDFDDLANGGMGTAYDWTSDGNVHLKGASAVASLKENQELATRLGLKFKEWVTPNTPATAANIEALIENASADSSKSKVSNLPGSTENKVNTVQSSISEQLQSNEFKDLVQDIIQQMLASNRLKIQSDL